MLHLDHLHLERRVDTLLAPWRRPDGPGVTIGVVRDGELVLHRSAGLASIELGVPLGPATTFRVASVTKQFTCAAILLLAAEGKLDPGDDIRTHLELPDFGQRVAVDHLMHNCSGLRDMLELMRLCGVDLQMPVRLDDLLAAIRHQRTLNFTPGSRFLYSNTNFLLLGLIVEKLAGESLSSFLERRVFAPLGMRMSRLVTNTVDVVPGLATGYLAKPDGGWVRAQHGFPLGGDGGLVSSVEDLALWDRNFTSGRVGGAALAGALTREMRFTGGALNAYARGLEVASYRGLRTIDHGGLWPGFKTEFLRLPERRLTVICIANSGTAEPRHLARQVVDAVVEGEPGVHPVPALPPRDRLAGLAGRYVDRANTATLDLAVADDGTPTATMNGVPFALAATADGRLAARRGVFPFVLKPAADGTLEIELDAGAMATFHRVAAAAGMPPGLAGRYACAELGAAWTIDMDAAGKASVRVAGPMTNAGPWDAEPVDGDILRIHVPGVLFRSWFDARAQRDGAGRVTGLLVNSARARGQVFARTG